MLMDFNNLHISGNRNEYPLYISCLLVYFICDVNMQNIQQDTINCIN